eukprot:4621764-Pleurochrysis_carterae.AAC.1
MRAPMNRSKGICAETVERESKPKKSLEMDKNCSRRGWACGNFDVVSIGRMLESDKSKLRFRVRMIACYGKQMAVATLSMPTVVWVTC